MHQLGELMRFTISANMAGIPAISIPVGHSRAGVCRQTCWHALHCMHSSHVHKLVRDHAQKGVRLSKGCAACA